MTKKDYILIARVIKDTKELYPEAQKPIEALILFFDSELGADNPRFNRDKFERACGL